MNTLAYWVTALATLALAIIAYKAKSNWKEEIKQKKVVELTRNLFQELTDFQEFLNYLENTQDDIWDDLFKEKCSKFKELKQEFKILNLDTETLFLNYLIDLTFYHNIRVRTVTVEYDAEGVKNYEEVDGKKFKEKYFYDETENTKMKDAFKTGLNFCDKQFKKFYG